MAKTEIDVRQLPTGLSREDFLMLPELKSVKSWFTWAGIVGIVTGIMGFAEFGAAAELEARGYSVNMGLYGFYAVLCVAQLVLGIILLRKKSTGAAYALAVLCTVTVVIALASGGRFGAGFIGTILAFFGARKLDRLWAEYQAL